ncbi:MAG: SDR family NAD(P)-dependent oxidoreductase [Clostridia bacterium]|nr:SDR family NAD(P)-dependent oxidoreductase [Clostridia bacterium]
MKFVLVTGAYGGMGKSAVNQLLDNGYSVIALDKTVGEKKENLFPVQVDLTDEKSVQTAYQKVKEITNDLYAIVHFAGIYALNSLVEIDEEKFVRIFNVNLFGAYRVNKTFLPLLKDGSRIIITTSELAPLAPLPFTGLYAVTKSALDKYAYSLRMEVQLLGIHVSVLRPGAVKTDMLGVSTRALDDFCDKSKLYSCNAKRFKGIVNSVEAKNVSPDKIAKVTLKAVNAKRPRFIYKINRNKLLLLLNILPQKLQTKIIKKILK